MNTLKSNKCSPPKLSQTTVERNYLRVDAGGGVRLRIARDGVERDGEEIHRVGLALLHLTDPNHPPSSTHKHTRTLRRVRGNGEATTWGEVENEEKRGYYLVVMNRVPRGSGAREPRATAAARSTRTSSSPAAELRWGAPSAAMSAKA